MCVILWMWMVVILLSRHGVVRKTLLHCMCLLMDQLGKSRAESYQGRDEAPMVEACGAEGGEYYVGAIRATNNTAEMQALIGALFWLNTCAKHKGLQSSSKVS